MELLVLNTNLESIAIVDVFESAIWTDRYNSFGDFEIYSKASKTLLSTLKKDYYLVLNDSEHVMIIEDNQIKFDVEEGDTMLFTGRSLESILERRIIWNQTVLSGNLQNGIQQLLNENIISATITDRRIPNFIFEASTDPAITSLTVNAQFVRNNLYDAIKGLCEANNIGFKITLSSDNKFVFKLYAGADRTYDQTTNPFVIFSPKYENLLSSSYLESKRTSKTVTLITGEGEEDVKLSTTVGGGSSLDRREMATDASSISQTVDGVLMPQATYLAQLAQKGTEDLASNITTQTFDGQVDTSRMFKYGEDFFMGDIVQIGSDYEIEGKARVVELIHSHSTSSIETYPKFAII